MIKGRPGCRKCPYFVYRDSGIDGIGVLWFQPIGSPDGTANPGGDHSWCSFGSTISVRQKQLRTWTSERIGRSLLQVPPKRSYRAHEPVRFRRTHKRCECRDSPGNRRRIGMLRPTPEQYVGNERYRTIISGELQVEGIADESSQLSTTLARCRSQ